MVDLGYILRRAWEIPWRHKTLWLFGLAVGLGTTGLRVSLGRRSLWEQAARELPAEYGRAIAGFLSGPFFIVVAASLALLAVAAAIGLALLGAWGRGALVDQVRVAEEHGRANLQAGWLAGRSNLRSVFLLRLLLGLPVSAITVAGAIPSLAGLLSSLPGARMPERAIGGIVWTALGLLACLVPAVCLAVLLSVPLNVLLRLAVRACVLEGRGVRGSIGRAWGLLREHVGLMALLWLLQFVATVVAIIVLGLPLVLVALTLMTAALLAGLFSSLLFVALTPVVGLMVWLVGAMATGAVETCVSTGWTLAYRELAGLGLTGEGA